MTSRTSIVTADQLAALPDDGNRYELVHGELRTMTPAGAEHGRLAHNLALLLGNHVRPHRLGVVYAAETGFLISRNPDTVRAPDVAFVEQAALETIGLTSGFLPFAPTLAGEVVSPRDSFSDVEAKCLGWLAAGTKVVLVVDPASKTVHVYRASDDISVLNEKDTLDASDAVSGWRLPVAEIFRS